MKALIKLLGIIIGGDGRDRMWGTGILDVMSALLSTRPFLHEKIQHQAQIQNASGEFSYELDLDFVA